MKKKVKTRKNTRSMTKRRGPSRKLLSQTPKASSAAKYWHLRAFLKQAMRDFFSTNRYTEVETPILVPAPGTEIYLNYFSTQWIDHQKREHNLFLRSSPELHMKQVLSQGMERIFQFAPCFRNEGELSNWHNPEFTMLEWYQTNIGYHDFMDQTADLLRYSFGAMKKKFPKDVKLSLPKKIRKISVAEAFKEFAGIELVDGDESLWEKAAPRGMISVRENDDFETAFFKILMEKIEPELTKHQAVILYDYPASMAALAKIDGDVSRRFEFYVDGIELSNAFEELLSPEENVKRIEDVNKKRESIGKQMIQADPYFIQALSDGLPPCCGNALGFDRWFGLLTGDSSLSAGLPFRDQIYLGSDT